MGKWKRLNRIVLGAGIALAGCAGPDGVVVPPRDAEGRRVYARPQAVEHYVRGIQQLNAGDEDEAIRSLEEAVILNPTLRMAHRTLGDVYRDRKRWADALPHYEAVATLDPYTASNHYFLGLTYQVLERIEESTRSYRRTLELEPDHFGANMNLGLALFTLGRPAEAMQYLERATQIDPGSARAWSNLGVIADAVGNASYAESAFRRALEIDPNSPATLLNLAGNLIFQGKADDAILVSEMLVRSSNSPTAYKRLGDAYTIAQRWPEAAKAYDIAYARGRNFTPALNAKAEMLIRQYQAGLELNDDLRRQAVLLWQQSLRINANQPEVEMQISEWQEAKLLR